MGKKIGIIFTYNENWMGGTYYVLNLLKALHQLPEQEQPEILILYRDDKDKEHISKIGYKKVFYHLLNQKYSSNELRINNQCHKWLGFRPINKEVKDNQLSMLFPVYSSQFGALDFQNIRAEKKVTWIPDLQEKHLPEFFTARELQERDQNILDILALPNPAIVFSSQAALQDFDHFYPNQLKRKYVLNFAVVHDFVANEAKMQEVMHKYELLNTVFFIAPNQFWIHKNHRVILEALLHFKNQGQKALVVFTGKEHDHRAPEYGKQIKEFAEREGLAEFTRFLGFIDRDDLLCLMHQSIAVIQPSFFEGWSTVVEDAKSLGKKVIASELKVHHEQLGERGSYFDPKDPFALYLLMEQTLQHPTERLEYGYKEKILQFATDFLRIAEQAIVEID